MQTRRDFLSHSLLVSGAVLLPGPLRRRSLSRTPSVADLHFGLVTYLWGSDLDLDTLLQVSADSGALGLELRTTHKHGVEPSLDAAARGKIRQRLADSPVTLVGIGSNERFDHPQPEDLARAIDASKEFIRLSHDVGGSGVKVKPDSFHKDVPREKTIEQIGHSLNEIGRFGAEFGQQIRLEVHGQCAHLPTIQEIMTVADHENVVVCWNCNKQDLEGEGLAHNFSLVQQRLGATVHIRGLDRHSYPYPELFRLLVEASYQGWVLLEARGELPEDRTAALRQQKALFEGLIQEAMRNHGKLQR
jgi:sugar phosphate isomerase/epimerase